MDTTMKIIPTIFKTPFGFHIDLTHIQSISDITLGSDGDGHYNAYFDISMIFQDIPKRVTIPNVIKTVKQTHTQCDIEQARKHRFHLRTFYKSPTPEEETAGLKIAQDQLDILLTAWKAIKEH